MVQTANKLKSKASEALEVFDQALTVGLVPNGQIKDRVVRAAFSSLSRHSPDGRLLSYIPNPFAAPHNLSWYFGVCTCPMEVRQFATRIGKGHLRVWSVAQDADGWRVLVQVFGHEGGVDSLYRAVEIEAEVPAKAMQKFVVSEYREADPVVAENVDLFMHSYVRGLLKRQGVGQFVEVVLRSKY